MSTFGEAVEEIKKTKEILDGQPVETEKHPDAKKHKYISFVKSGFRILAGATLFFGEFAVAGALLIVAEILGIAEELV
jgi:tRNA-binding EMAP/Myf-like protein